MMTINIESGTRDPLLALSSCIVSHNHSNEALIILLYTVHWRMLHTLLLFPSLVLQIDGGGQIMEGTMQTTKPCTPFPSSQNTCYCSHLEAWVWGHLGSRNQQWNKEFKTFFFLFCFYVYKFTYKKGFCNLTCE